MNEAYKSRVYTDRPAYADFDAPAKFQAIRSIVERRLVEHPNAICSYSGGADSDIMIDVIERARRGLKLPPVKYVFFNTGLEMRATKDHVRATAEKYGVEIQEVRPKIGIVTASRRYGIPFVSKIMSAGLSEWQKKGVPLSIAEEYDRAEDKAGKRQELRERYPRCESVINFLCCCNAAGEPRPHIQLVINSSKYMRDFVGEYPPDFPISAKCCEGYDLPPLEVRKHVVHGAYGQAVDRDGQIKLQNDAAVSLSEEAREKRESIAIRVDKAKEIVAEDPEAHFLLWHDLEAERHALIDAFPEAVDIYGAMDYEERERRVIGFSEGQYRLFATKKSLSGSGCNFQRHCHRAIFLGIDYEFNDFIQAVHRIYRFLQTEPVVIDIICTEAEDPVFRALMAKWEQHEHLQGRMREIVKKYGLSRDAAALVMARSIGVDRVEIKGEHWTAVNSDCVEETAKMPENSVDLIVTSIPFSNHYEYTPSYNDFGHNEDTERFFEQMGYLTTHLLRVLKPGRVFACHVKDRVLFGSATGMGMPTMEPFHALCIQHYMSAGFAYFGMITVVTDVVRENNQTYRLGWTEQCKDGTKMGVGCPEYILLFRKLPTDRSKAYADEPVRKSKEDYTRAQWQLDAHGFWRSSGDRLLTKAELERMPVDRLQAAYRTYSRGTVYSYAEHVALARKLDADSRLPATFMVVAPGSWTDQVWDDINRMRTLNTAQSQRRKQLHVCPLQLDIVDRLIERYSSPGELVLDPFGGLGTVALQAVKAGRRGYTIELNSDYFRDAVGYLRELEERDETISLFDLMGGAV